MRALSLLLICAGLFACGMRGGPSEAEATEIANAYLLAQEGSPGTNSLPGLHVEKVVDRGKTWLVDYGLNSGWIGGAPQLVVDKAARRVIAHENQEQ